MLRVSQNRANAAGSMVTLQSSVVYTLIVSPFFRCCCWLLLLLLSRSTQPRRLTPQRPSAAPVPLRPVALVVCDASRCSGPTRPVSGWFAVEFFGTLLAFWTTAGTMHA